VIYRISGAFFFGAATMIGSVLDRIAGAHRNLILDLSDAPFIDSTAANVVGGSVRKARHASVRVFVTGASPQARRVLIANGVRQPVVAFFPTIDDALAEITESEAKPAA
jgi:SulP family sulfate permease